MAVFDISGKVALITGANRSGGIGAEIARKLAAEGVSVFLHGYRSNPQPPQVPRPEKPGEARYRWEGQQPLSKVVGEIRAQGWEAEGREGDLRDPALIPALFDSAEETFGPVDILINNAAGWQADTFLPEGQTLPNQSVELWTERPGQITPESFERNFAVNTRAPVLLIAEFVNRHLDRSAGKGRIVNISTAGAYVFPSEVSYGASKFALEGYTRSAAVELGSLGITVNVIAPGPVQTGWITEALEARILPTIPMGRIGLPADIAQMVLFLVSDQADWITGQTMYVGGGHGM
jgi:3-oxoacyl-[acyl-carrier protein] reductase